MSTSFEIRVRVQGTKVWVPDRLGVQSYGQLYTTQMVRFFLVRAACGWRPHDLVCAPEICGEGLCLF